MLRAHLLSVLDPQALGRLAALYGGLPLLGCLPGSPAARAGLRWGDIVVAVNGSPTPDVDSFVAAKGFRDGTMSVNIVRDGKELQIILKRGAWDPLSMEDVAREMILSRSSEAPESPDTRRLD
jgi:S1-C subfamily serine protease